MGPEAPLQNYDTFVGYGQGESGFYVTVFLYGSAVMHGTMLTFLLGMEG